MSVARTHLEITADRGDIGHNALWLLREASDRLASGPILEAVMPDILATAITLTAATGAALLWRRNETFQLICSPSIEPAAEPLLLWFRNLDLDQSGPVQSDGREVREAVKATASLRVPLRARGKAVGTFAVFTDQEQSFSTRREHLLSLLAVLTAQAIDADALAIKSHRRSLFLTGLRRVSQDVAAYRNSQALLQEIADISLDTLGADFVVLYEYLEEEKDVRIPPIRSGDLWSADILERRGAVISHRESVVFKLLDEKKPIYAPDALHDWQRRGLARAAQGKESFLVREGVISSAGVPLVFDNKAMGVLFVNYRTPQSFDQEQQDQIELFSSQAALTISLTRHTTHLATLTEVGTRLSSEADFDIDRILDLIYKEAVKLLRGENLYILLYNEEKKAYTFPLCRGTQEPLDKLSATELRKTLADYVIRTRGPCLVDTKRYRQLIAEEEILPVERLGLTPAKIWLGAPMIARGNVLGMIAVQDYENEEFYDQDDLNLLRTLASQAAIAIDNARLFQKVQIQRTSDQILTRFQDLRLALQDLLREIVHALESDGGVIFLRDRDIDKIRVVVTYRWSELKNRRLKWNQGLAGKIAAAHEPMYENDYANWPEKAPFFRRGENREKIGSALGIPIIAHGELLGVVTVTSHPERKRRYTDIDVERLNQFVGPRGPVVAALEMARNSSFQKALIDNSPYPVLGANSTGLLTIFNTAAAKLTGYERKEVLDQKADKIYWNGPLEVLKIQRRLERDRGNIQMESAIRTKSGEKIQVLLSVAFLTDEHGLLGSVTILEDLRLGSLRGKNRDLMAAINRIDRYPHKLKDLTDTIVGEAMKLFEADAGCLFLASGAQFRARSNLHAPGRSLQELVLTKSSPLVRETLRSRVSSLLPAGPAIGEVSLLPEGREAGLLIPMADDTEVLGILFLECSVGKKDHFRYEREFLRVFAVRCATALRKARLEEALLRTGGTLAAAQVGTIHEIKNALSNLFWDIHEIKETSAARTLGKRLQSIDGEIERLSELTERLREFSNNLEPRKKHECLNDIVLRTAEGLDSAIRSKGVSLEVDLDPALDHPNKQDGRMVLVDKVQISQVITNLALNALDAFDVAHERGKILIQTKLRGDKAEMRVADTGRGLTAAQRRNLFKPFLTVKPKGSGLGLAIARLIIEDNHSGRISVRSKPGKGTTVLVLLPLSTPGT
jgi:PAS domain S-box-containing protein